jgi:ADP-dependent NAD(P)H-hydrate dehydratase / NAD(P)H-hydrate epimerase
MIPVLTAGQMRQADRRTIDGGASGAALMERAGTAVAVAVSSHFAGARRPLVLCGKGNNGGDGFVAARHLLRLRPRVALLARRGDVVGDARAQLAALDEASDGAASVVEEVPDEAAWKRFRPALAETDVIIDALLGTGIEARPRGIVGVAIEELAGLSGIPIVSVDLPSGISSDSGLLPWPTVNAALTVTFGAPKMGLVQPPACDRCGVLVVADIGIPAAVVNGTSPSLWLLEDGDVRAVYPPRLAASHKGSYGHLLIIAGSVGKAGAAGLAASAALRSGVGLVTIATAGPALASVAAWRAEAMTEALASTADGAVDRGAIDRALALAKERDAVALGPGLGSEESTRDFVRAFVRRCPVPLLLDADGLNAVAAEDGGGRATLSARSSPTVLTPHPGEMGRLSGLSVPEVQQRRVETARELAAETGAIVVLKGQRTVVARRGGAAAVNPTGNPGMAKGGSGDVLSGMIGALLARGADPWSAACAGVFLHGWAGDRAAASLGQESLLAMDLVEELPAALQSLSAERG